MSQWTTTLNQLVLFILVFFFFNDTATTEIYTLSLHDALPISRSLRPLRAAEEGPPAPPPWKDPVLLTPRTLGASLGTGPADRKSTRLNSSHANISYAVFCLKKKK